MEREELFRSIRHIITREWPNTSPGKADRVANRILTTVNENNPHLSNGHCNADVRVFDEYQGQ